MVGSPGRMGLDMVGSRSWAIVVLFTVSRRRFVRYTYLIQLAWCGREARV